MRQRSAFVTFLALVAFATAGYGTALASGGTYDVVYCSSLNRPSGGIVESGNNAFTARSHCSDPDRDLAFKIDNVARAADGRSAIVHWDVEPPLGIVGVSVEGRLRRADGYDSTLFMADENGHFTEEVAAGDHDPGEWQTYSWHGTPQRRFVASLKCGEAPSCPASTQAHTWVRNLRFTVADYSDPELEVDGSLFDGGWLRGARSVTIRATDSGGGVDRLTATVNDSVLANETGECAGRIGPGVSATYAVCLATASVNTSVGTDETPFVNGTNEIRSCVFDFGNNSTCETRTARVDNEPPQARFAFQNDQDPELVRVPVQDLYSGLADGEIYYRRVGSSDWTQAPTQVLDDELRARIDSASEEPGTYEFQATATDVAGNSSETTSRQDGSTMTLEFPLKSGVHLDSRIEPGGSRTATIAYGRHARVEGRLVNSAGEPMAGQVVTVDESFGPGALIDHRIRSVMTNGVGRWSSKLPAGPSRSVTASYAGNQRYLADESDAGTLAVKSGAKLGLSRKHVPEGRSTVFHGRVGRLGARIPDDGKVVQLQYQDPITDRWSTVRNPFHTKSDGRYAFRYTFGTHYIEDVAIRFRLKVPTERGWPYRGARTKARRVIVEARQ